MATLSRSPFMDLPTELHAHVASFLSYPDALALKHTNTYFYSLVQTGLVLKVNWILERCRLNLRIPFTSCEFRTDQTFCNSEIREIMEIRRRHQECKPGARGCVVVEGSNCGGRTAFWLLRRRGLFRWQRKRLELDFFALVIGILVCFVAIICIPALRFFTKN
ncbi:F-box domain-containing protein [Histoplasma ohiense]|uniref:F-box domain-containing protein n=1 Tax=Ajellomyces capsulatus TaxID=5037 RepID=A0A8H7YZS0_AJECA|nr:F-box domain-containing protein [Histoplasma capsulatum]KAG5301573.1 F-box domain-containing protein [Histoplasma ohiense (nom. inval.)]QSS68268.1 F-box domain-containing protein [Histoplasma capsulatum G186AR]